MSEQSLDQRLRELLFEIRTDVDYDADGNKVPITEDGEFIAQIKLALADEGYVLLPDAMEKGSQ